MNTHLESRMEHDLLGPAAVPAAAYYGIQTQRAKQNFSITGVPISHFPHFIRALAMVKQAACRANKRLGLLPAETADAIERACADIGNGALHDQFIVDVIQGGATAFSECVVVPYTARCGKLLGGGKSSSDDPCMISNG